MAGGAGKRWVAAALVLAAAGAQAQPGTPPAAPAVPTPPQLPVPLVVQGHIPPAWRVAGVPGQKMPLTQFTAVPLQGRDAVRLDATASYGNLVQDLPGLAAPALLSWSWRVDEANPQVNLATKAGDDSPAKVCLAFELPLASMPFVERQLLRMARGRSGENLPAATLCWVWAAAESVGAVLPNAYTRRLRYIVLRNQATPLGRWMDETRDVAADFARAFGDESATPPPLAALIVGADADNTAAQTRAFVADLRWGR